jgi:ADP-ribose pyrophosphatase YjhB (NUDIX family)
MVNFWHLNEPMRKVIPGEIPGGRMEFGETLTETLIREVKEETSLDIQPIHLLSHWDLIGQSKQISGVVFLCKITSGEVKLSEEHKDFTWFEKDDWNRLYPAFAKIVNELDDFSLSD